MIRTAHYVSLDDVGVLSPVQTMEIDAPPVRGMIVEMSGCTICGSDLHSYRGRRHAPPGTILGHEMVGRVVEIDSAWGVDGDSGTMNDKIPSDRITVGDRVIWSLVASCGSCELCAVGLPQKCKSAFKYGHGPMDTSLGPCGGLSDTCMIVPGTVVLKVPESLPLEVVCPASCATATATAILETAGNIAGKTVGLFGGGLLGLSCLAIAKTRGVGSFIVVDPSEHRRRFAESFHADQVLGVFDFEQDKGRTHDLDIAIDCSGSVAAIRGALQRLRTGGRLILAGSVFPCDSIDVNPETIVRQHWTIAGVHNYAPRQLRQALQFLGKHHKGFPFSDVVSQWFPLDQTAEAFAAAEDPRRLRVGVRP